MDGLLDAHLGSDPGHQGSSRPRLGKTNLGPLASKIRATSRVGNRSAHIPAGARDQTIRRPARRSKAPNRDAALNEHTKSYPSAPPAAPSIDNTDIPLLDLKIGRGLFASIVLNLVLDGLSLVERM
jgi:hypothetical protein